MHVLLTGAFGNVGRSVLHELINRNITVRVFEMDTPRNRRLAGKYKNQAEIHFGDILNVADVGEAVRGIDVIIHLAAIIPPLADRRPKLAHYVNVSGTENIVRAAELQKNPPKILFSSSVAIYGDRLESPHIKIGDPLTPNSHDTYAWTKLECENLIRKSSLTWAIFRLTYIVSPKKLRMDPLMYDMPLNTSVELCDTKDVGFAAAEAAEHGKAWGKTLHIAGGESCRMSYREYLDRMMECFGLGSGFLPEEAFGTSGFHCGYMDTEESSRLLHFQHHTKEDYFLEVKNTYSGKRFFLYLIQPFARWYILMRSKYYRTYLAGMPKKGAEAVKTLMQTIFFRKSGAVRHI